MAKSGNWRRSASAPRCAGVDCDWRSDDADDDAADAAADADVDDVIGSTMRDRELHTSTG